MHSDHDIYDTDLEEEVFSDEDTIDEPIHSHNSKNYRILKAMDIRRLMEEDISKTSTILSVSTDISVALLRHYNWNITRANEEWNVGNVTLARRLILVATSTLVGIIDTVSAEHPIFPLLNILKPHGKLVMVCEPPKALELPVFLLLMGRKIMGGSIIGGMKETQEMLDFAAKHNITPEVEVVSMDYVNTNVF
ncbi:hypothetical protein RND71_025301 [Anisodus tanguticus]|uniref:E3 ubiquitin-protein ligase ARIH1-like UBA-like domain-containing protein n=1 Tax=Anisodus tanguticus TaxID=243964 RepID=A0AAE1RPZ0_9SOLA|nr:hypothetical protein RND71_025301 [Anisodus tanguticus]